MKLILVLLSCCFFLNSKAQNYRLPTLKPFSKEEAGKRIIGKWEYAYSYSGDTCFYLEAQQNVVNSFVFSSDPTFDKNTMQLPETSKNILFIELQCQIHPIDNKTITTFPKGFYSDPFYNDNKHTSIDVVFCPSRSDNLKLIDLMIVSITRKEMVTMDGHYYTVGAEELSEVYHVYRKVR